MAEGFNVAPEGSIYKVQKGDSLSKIAARLGITVDDLMKFNVGRIKDKNKIKEGQEIFIANPTPPPPPSPFSKGPIQGKGGAGFMLNYDKDAEDESKKIKTINPTSGFGRPASAVEKQKGPWVAGDEIPNEKKLQIPVAVEPPPPPPPPHPPLYFGDQGQALGEPEYQKAVAGATNSVPGLSAWQERGIRDLVHLGTAMGPLGAEFAPLQAMGPVKSLLGQAKPFGTMADDAPLAAESAVQNIKSDILPTPRMRAKTEAAIRARTRGGKAFDAGADDLYGLSNVRDQAPAGAKEINVQAPKPLKVDAAELKSVDDWRKALRSAADNTVVLDGSDAVGFSSPRVIITKGQGPKNFDPEHYLEADHPVVPQGVMTKILKYLSLKD